MRHLKKRYGCPVEFTLDFLGGKWKTCILARLKNNPMRYGELRARMPQLSDKMLSERLHELEEVGLIARAPTEGGHVVYQLTERMDGLLPVLEALYGWGEIAADELEISFEKLDFKWDTEA